MCDGRHNRHTLRAFHFHSLLQVPLLSLDPGNTLAKILGLRFCPSVLRPHLFSGGIWVLGSKHLSADAAVGKRLRGMLKTIFQKVANKKRGESKP